MAHFIVGNSTASAGDPIVALCPPNGTKVPVLERFVYLAAATEHSAHIGSVIGVTTTTDFTGAGDTTTNLASINPGKTTAGEAETLANNDYVAVINVWGGIEMLRVTSLSGSTVTWTAAPTYDVAAGAMCYAFYEYSRGPKISCRASTLEDFTVNAQAGLGATNGVEWTQTASGRPMALFVDNITNAGTLEYASFTWLDDEEDFLG